jgi:hypothetical protein
VPPRRPPAGLQAQLGLLAHADAFLLDHRFRGNIRQVLVCLDVGADFAQRPRVVAGLENVVRPAAIGDDDILGADGRSRTQQVLRVSRPDADVAGANSKPVADWLTAELKDSPVPAIAPG